MSLNHISIMGRLTRDPELRRTASGTACANFTLAVDRDFSKDNETDFIDCVTWGKTAEFVERNFSKGRMMIAAGRLQIRTWQDRDGNKRRNAEVVADNVYFGDSKKESNADNFGNIQASQVDDYAVLDGDNDDLPF